MAGLIEFDTQSFQAEHGHRPTGLGKWCFAMSPVRQTIGAIATVGERIIHSPFTRYDHARRHAIAYAKSIGASRIQVEP